MSQLFGVVLSAIPIHVEGVAEVDSAWAARVVRRIEAAASACPSTSANADHLIVRFTPGLERILVSLERVRMTAPAEQAEVVGNPEDASWVEKIDSAMAQLCPEHRVVLARPPPPSEPIKVGPLVAIGAGALLATSGLVFAAIAQSTSSGIQGRLVYQPGEQQQEVDRLRGLEMTAAGLVISGALAIVVGLLWDGLIDPTVAEPSG